MSIEVDSGALLACGVCGAHVKELRRGRCWGCYLKWAEMRPVGRGATCAVCGERRREQLRMVELQRRSVPLCHGCASRTLKLADAPGTVEELRRVLARDRRADDRRGDGRDHRIFQRERRVGDRRGPPREAHRGDTDPHFVLPDYEDLEIQLSDGDYEIIEETIVRER